MKNLIYGLNSNEYKNEEICKSNYSLWNKLDDSFISLYLQAIQESEDNIQPKIKESGEYINFISFHRTQFEIARSISIIFRKGYSMPAYSLLRNMGDENLFMSGVFQGFTTFAKLCGIYEQEENDSELIKKIEKNCKNEREQLIKNMLYGNKNFSKDNLSEINLLRSGTNQEIHGSKLSKFHHLISIYSNDFSIKNLDTLFLNHYFAVTWMLLRLLPLIQTDFYKFSVDWKKNWKELDKTFRNSWIIDPKDQSQKPMGIAITALIDLHFYFDEEAVFTLHNKRHI